jgi:DNA-binding response OmpR family regulator
MSSDGLKFSDFEKIFPPAESRPKPMQMASSGGLKTRILLGDDDPVHTLTVFQALVDAGYEVVVANEALQVITELRKPDHPLIALVDVQLPGMNPTDLCQRMHDADKTVYLIFFDDEPTTAEIVAGLAAGADLWLSKSIPILQLVAHLQAGLRVITRQKAMVQRLEALTGGPTPHA